MGEYSLFFNALYDSTENLKTTCNVGKYYLTFEQIKLYISNN